MIMKRSKKSEGPDPDAKVVLASFMSDVALQRIDDPEARAQLPHLWDHIAPIFSGACLQRQAGRITISIEGDHYRVTVSCPTEKVQTTLITSTLLGCLEELNRYLAMPTRVYAPTWERNKKKLPVIDDLI
jgi:hypothetical protein